MKMEKLKILNKKETEDILGLIKEQWDADMPIQYVYLMNTQDRIYVTSRDVFNLDLDKLKINSVGMYFGEILKGNQLRLSIEGSQLAGPLSKKDVVDLDDEEARKWLRGLDLDIQLESKGFVLVRHGRDFLGCGKSMGDKILNYVPKARRVTSSD